MEEKVIRKQAPVKIQTKAVHSGDRKKVPASIPVTTPITTATTFLYEKTEDLDKIFAREEAGYCYSRYDNPTNSALEELMSSLEGGAGALACSSGMSAVHAALLAALTDRRKSVIAADALYGATMTLLMKVLDPLGVETRFVDITDVDKLKRMVDDEPPGCILMETVSNPLLRVGPIDQVASIAQQVGAALIVDSTFATPMIVRPMEFGANFVVHSLTKYLAGHGDVLGGVVVTDAANLEVLRALSRAYGPVLGPFESYLTMRGIKTFPLRMERQCVNACRISQWLALHPRVERVYFPADPKHPDATTIARIFSQGLFGAMVSFELKEADQEAVFQFMDSLKLVVRGTSLGDVHTMVLYPAMSSHRELSPKHRQRMGIRDNLIRLSVGIEAPEDILSDLEQALTK